MGIEIERKFLLKNDSWKIKADNGTSIKQGYLNSHKDRTVRVRIYGTIGFLTIKGKTEKFTRQEYEYEIPLQDATELLALCEKPLIEKTRYLVIENFLTWEVDIFEGKNLGLKIAEIEIEKEQTTITLPEWVGEEVSHDPKYYNSSLILKPYTRW